MMQILTTSQEQHVYITLHFFYNFASLWQKKHYFSYFNDQNEVVDANQQSLYVYLLYLVDIRYVL